MLSEQALQDFKRIWKEEYGEEIPEELVFGRAINLLKLFDEIYRPLKRGQIQEKEHGGD